MPEPAAEPGAGVSHALGSRYELVKPLGHGAMGEVWQAWDRKAERYLAAKLLHPQLVEDPDILARFLQERAILIGLDHPNIVRIHDMVVEGNSLAIVLDLVEGGSVGDFRRSAGTASAAVAAPVVAAVLDALAYAHDQGVLHRDVKPDNILLAEPGPPRPETVRLSDFGIARLTQEGTVKASSLIGTPLYMPPELFRDGQVSPKSDVYAAGIVLYELLAGRTPFAGPGNAMTIGWRHVRSAVPPLPVAPALWQLVMALLAKDPAHRPTASEAADCLRGLASAGLDSEPLPPQPVPDVWPDTGSFLPSRLLVEGKSDEAETAPRTSVRPISDSPPDADVTLRSFSPEVTRVVSPQQAVAGDIDKTHVNPLSRGGADTTALAPPGSSPPGGPGPEVPVGTIEAPPGGDRPGRGWTPRLKRWAPIVGVVAVVGLAFLVLGATGVIGARPQAGPPSVATVSAHPDWRRGVPRPSGLELDVAAAFVEADDTTTLTVTATAPRSTGLSGDVLLVVPPFDDRPCDAAPTEPLPGPSATLTPVKASADGIAIGCAYKLVGLQLAKGESKNLVFPLAGGPAGDYGPWLEAIQQQTDAALQQITGTTFPLQRLEGLALTAQSVNLGQGNQPVAYQVTADWGGAQSAVPGYVLVTSATEPGSETPALLALTGGAGVSAVTVTTCSAAHVQVGTTLKVVADQPTDSCPLTVRIGELEARGSFAVYLNR